MAVGEGPTVAVPERLDRTLRLGPFASGRDALKFVAYAAVGAVLVPFAGALVWLPFVGAGLAVSLWRPGGEALDDRCARYLRWKLGVRPRGRPVNGGRPGPRSVVRLPTGYAAVVRSGGLPLAYLPSDGLARRFEQYRELLRAIDGSILLLASRAPIHAAPLRPAEPPPVGPERPARDGYRELVEVIVRRRHLRQVLVALTVVGTGPEAAGRLDDAVASLVDRLAALGVRSGRLRDRALDAAVQRLGLSAEGGPT
jgi:hypothetical protein